MGITIEHKKHSYDLGYGGFMMFRQKVATLSHEEFGAHYETLKEAMLLAGEDRFAFYDEYNVKTDKLIERNIVTIEIANFCYQADCEGSISRKQAKQIYEKIKDYDDDIPYGYEQKSHCTMFSDLKAMFKDCAEKGGRIKWL